MKINATNIFIFKFQLTWISRACKQVMTSLCGTLELPDNLVMGTAVNNYR